MVCTLEKLPSTLEALLLNLLPHYGHTMHFSWMLRLSTISAILASLCILSSAIPTSFTPTRDTVNFELNADALSGPLGNLPALPRTQSISKRSALIGYSYHLWGNGWTSRSNTYVRRPLQTPHSPKTETLTPQPRSWPSSPSSPPPPSSPSSTPASCSSPTPSRPTCQPAAQQLSTAFQDKWCGISSADLNFGSSA